MFDTLLAWDAAAARACSALAGRPPLDVAMSALTVAGLYGGLWIAIGLVLALTRRGHVAGGFVRLFWSVLLVTLLVDGLKPLIGRERPDTTHLARTTATALATSRTHGYSFPSGHAAQAIAGVYALTFLWPERRALLWLLGLLVAFSRVYLGVHYPLDVLAGGVLGYLVARLATARAPCYISGSANAAPDVPR